MEPGIDRRRAKLSEVARHVVTPEGIVGSEWPSVRLTCRRLGWDFDGWQDGASMLILSLNGDGEYAADTIVISIPRQVGKTYIIGCIIFALCLMKPGLKVIWTAQVKDTALETFEKFYDMSQGPKVQPHIEATPKGKGDEAIVFTNGSKIEFGARDSGFGRGRTDVDVLVFDEGQHLSLQALENMGAAQNVAVNPLCLVMGTPPRPQDKGEFFTVMRQEAVDGESDGTLYIEMSADRGCDPMDRAQWMKANPSFPHRTTERAMLRLRKKLRNEDSWRREALGIWDDVSSHQIVVSPSQWAELVDVGPDAGVRPDALAVDMSHAREISVGACWIEGDSAHVEEVWRGTDEAAATAWVAERAGRRMPVVIDDASPAASMQIELKQRGVNVVRSGATDMARACGLAAARIKAGTLSHAGQQSVNDAAEGARKRPIGTAGGWGLDRKDSTVSIFPLVAAFLALLGATKTHRPGRSTTKRVRKAVIG
ncbi:hypothetical protein nbrc107696_06390 [Gordonia spumicola]|uniref:Terminase n=1 Tax=Gordonia spumicola TaxID=589161 RepID=A0A7I9V4S4_9ACTN|nr:terminase [Gordonia spumicola]GEE00193.1 hypothetical protein nbrc107696_06390 [Gordonia spumicola]